MNIIYQCIYSIIIIMTRATEVSRYQTFNTWFKLDDTNRHVSNSIYRTKVNDYYEFT